MSANGQAEESPQQESPQQGIQSIEVDAQVLRALEVRTVDGPIIVRWDSGTHVLPINVRVGSVLPLLDSAVGSTSLAHLPAAQTAGVLATQQARQETHTPGAAALEKLLVKTRRDGIASSLHRMIYGMAAFGAPVFGPDRGPRARDRPHHARPPGWSRAMGARPTGWPTRSAVPPGRSRPNWDTARRNAPAPTRPQRWRR
jgi:Bacterial transcriptional regulator